LIHFFFLFFNSLLAGKTSSLQEQKKELCLVQGLAGI